MFDIMQHFQGHCQGGDLEDKEVHRSSSQVCPGSPSARDLAGMHIFSKASAKGKRVQCNMGTKNHDVVMQDVDLEATLNTLVGAAFLAAGQQCMAINTAPQFLEIQSPGKKVNTTLSKNPRTHHCQTMVA
ncbi:hypothetical protein CY35_06G006000 [Sphagnum magellanicum]|nr:hypothetical protein CY35_06G006000 [Sphagnum magellanicum]